MTEILKNMIHYLGQIYNFPIHESVIVMAAVAFLYFFGCAFVTGLKRKITKYVIVSGLLFSFYVSQVIGLTLLNRTITEEARYDLNMIDVYRIAFSGNSVFMTQLIGNVIMFIPFGILVPICFQKIRGILKITLISFLASLFIETTQLYTHTGLFELVDLLNNTLGGIIGYLIYKIFYFVYKIIK
ncbi:MAG: VanZ family protein [Lachnospiraceae bacterium]|nr:VanZ family protein [Lachnospiraceae bacterium]